MKVWSRLFGRGRLHSDLSEEIAQHIAERTEALISEGLGRHEARLAARREFGNVTGIEETSRDVWRWPIADTLLRDARVAIRQLRRNPGFTFTVAVTLALGIGASTAIFSLVHAVVLRPLPFPESDRLMWMNQRDSSRPGGVAESVSYPDYFDWRAGNLTFSGMASYETGTATLQSSGEPRRVDIATVSSNFFATLGVAPILGRDFAPDDEKPGSRAVMLSYSLWQSTFNSERDIAAKMMRLDGRAYAIAGVMPKDFQFPLGNPTVAMWVSLGDAADGKDAKTSQRGFDCLDLIGRLKPAVTPDQAQADLSRIARNLARQYPDNNKWFDAALVEPELQHLTRGSRPPLWILFGAVTLLLLMACANVAGLLLARGSRRASEFALRVSIGASRFAIVRQLLVESIALSLCGAVLGVLVAFVLLRSIVSLVPLDIPRMQDAAMDGTVLLFVAAVAIVTGLLFGILPALRVSRSAPLGPMREGSRSLAGSRGEHRIHSSMVIAQTAIALLLLVGSGLLIRSFVKLANVDPGFDPANVMTARLGVPFETISRDQHYRFYEQLLSRIATLPGVQTASAGWPMPMSNTNAGISFQIEGRPVPKGDEPSASLGIAMPGYFETLRIPLVAGRDFGLQDGASATPVIIINQAFARKYFAGENPLGRRVQVMVGDGVFNRPMREVVGVAGDIRRASLAAGAEPQFFLPYPQAVVTNPFLAIRSAGNPAALVGAIRAAVHELDRNVPVYQVTPLEDYVSRSAASPRFETMLLSGFAAIALLLTAIGLYGLLSYLVAQRNLEIGLRMALGARREDVLRMVLRRGLRLALVGLAAGLALSAVIIRLMAGLLYGIQATDGFSFAAAAGVLLVVSVEIGRAS